MIVDSVLSDVSGISPEVLLWQDCFSVLKHGGHAIVICGVSNYHRVACAMEDSGFEIRDSIMWVYSSDDGEFSSAVEPIVLARKPLIGSIADNVVKYGVGALHIDGCRVRTAPDEDLSGIKAFGSMPKSKVEGQGFSRPWMNDKQSVLEKQNAAISLMKDLGRFPANLCHDGSSGVVGLFPRAGNNWKRNYGEEDYKGKQYRGGSFGGGGYKGGCTYADSGSAARFFYNTPRNPNDTSTKPLQFLRYLCRLITPPNGIVFDPFPNAQTPIEEAAKAEGFSYKRG